MQSKKPDSRDDDPLNRNPAQPMAGVHSLIIPGEPQGKARAKVTTRGGHAHAYTPGKTELYENLIKVLWLESRHAPIEGAIVVWVTAVFGIPKSASKAQRAEMEAGRLWPCKKPDFDNIGKVIADALNGLAWLDDKQICDSCTLKRYTRPGEQPHVRLIYSELNPPPQESLIRATTT